MPGGQFMHKTNTIFLHLIVNNAKCKATEFSANLKLQDENFVRKQLDCVLNQGPCDKIGITIKSKFIDI